MVLGKILFSKRTRYPVPSVGQVRSSARGSTAGGPADQYHALGHIQNREEVGSHLDRASVQGPGAGLVFDAAVAADDLAVVLFPDFGAVSFLSFAAVFGAAFVAVFGAAFSAVFGASFPAFFGVAFAVVFRVALAFFAAGGSGCTATTPELETFTLTFTFTLVELKAVSALRLVPFAGGFEAIVGLNFLNVRWHSEIPLDHGIEQAFMGSGLVLGRR
ncbi:hypothetical protein N7492_007549 [Penicillium capsulatum]|uniref:Uncharacterized protein n=1 Tax=Penicillium capsulatum TaxID=69766 RepID=A0A9W9I035_9EURO|nr:hypothetical protein N7492_007549 [Penicillium capsulatum]KAJ6117383.1 hypothetical protein N7512_007108 [Penicillium capsulatum]